MSVERCTACGAEVPAYYLSAGLCDSCKWDTWIPRGHEAREEYVYSEVWGHSNATVAPPTGVEFLDRKPKALNELLPMCRRNPRIGSWASPRDTSKTRH